MSYISLLLETAERLASQFNASQSRLATCDTQLVCKVESAGVLGVQLVFFSVASRSIREPEKVYDFLSKNAPNLQTIICFRESLDKCVIIAF